MRHRIGGLENVSMGLAGDNIPFDLDNTWSGNAELNKTADKMFDDALESIFKDIGAFDFKVRGNAAQFEIAFGFEPAYKHDKYRMVKINQDINKCQVENGVAVEYYGGKVRIDKIDIYGTENCDEKFTAFVDKWHPKLMEALTLKLL